MPNHESHREADDIDRTDPRRAAASLQGIAAAWLLVLAAGLVAILPTAVDAAEHSVLRTARAAQLELTTLARTLPHRLLAHQPALSRSAGRAVTAAGLPRLDGAAI
ncbi:MAG TPA: hypothetical protein VMC10_00485 [Stellaceae bacterium]|nr:hypothetical protein [Stellaceae bacterium]